MAMPKVEVFNWMRNLVSETKQISNKLTKMIAGAKFYCHDNASCLLRLCYNVGDDS